MYIPTYSRYGAFDGKIIRIVKFVLNHLKMFSRYFLAFCVVALLAVAVTAKAIEETTTEQAEQVTEQPESTTTVKPSKRFWDYVLGVWKYSPIGFATHKLIELNNKKQQE
ncbi:uncharacterized protein LOC103315529 [Nasonia vitripennis]|uniref:Uncharacterized protein n=1 Tax=Nasonia vitripennis TaxID=7425 RepID=A0A7M7LQE9_NASVI|nr:uncharacterized protein LOC103315529 [Nasonia vitripennis]